MSDQNANGGENLATIPKSQLTTIGPSNPLVARGIAELAKSCELNVNQSGGCDLDKGESYLYLGWAWYETDDYTEASQAFEDAIRFFHDAIGMGHSSARVYCLRGKARLGSAAAVEALAADQGNEIAPLFRRGLCRKAIEDFERAIELDQDNYYWRAKACHYGKQSWDRTVSRAEAVRDFGKIIRLGRPPEDDNPALLLAASPDAGPWDDKFAEEIAKKAAKRTNWKDCWSLASLAAVCAELGHFGGAICYQKDAWELARGNRLDDAVVAEFRRCLDLYQQQGGRFPSPLSTLPGPY
jgi:tetratricopeptide (TPR) repeat protein